MKTRIVILLIAVVIGNVFAGHWRFISDTVRVRVDTSCTMCAWGTAETDTPITVGHQCMHCYGVINSLLYREYFKDYAPHTIWAYKGDCSDYNGGDCFGECGDPVDSCKWVHFWDTFTIDEDWTDGGQLCSLCVFCISVPYQNEFIVKINSKEIIDRSESSNCTWVCVRGDEWGIDSDSSSLFYGSTPGRIRSKFVKGPSQMELAVGYHIF